MGNASWAPRLTVVSTRPRAAVASVVGGVSLVSVPSIPPLAVVGSPSIPAPGSERAPRVAIADGSSNIGGRIADALREVGYDVVVRGPGEHYDLLRSEAADLVLIDLNLPGGSGFELCGELRAADGWAQTPIILLSSAAEDKEVIVRGLMCGADDCLIAVADDDRIAELQARIRVQLRNKRERDRLQRMRQERDVYLQAAATDTLTGVANRRALDSAMDRLFNTGRRFAILFLDVDHFKRVNDEFGHATGDEVLQRVSECMRKHSRPNDFCGRFGGEEFVLLAPDVDGRTAMDLAESHRLAIASLTIPSIGRAVTASFGVATHEPGGADRDVKSVCSRADAALYTSKKVGRNRVTLAAPAGAPPVISIAPDPTTIRAAAEELLVKELATGRAGLPLLPASAAEALRLAEDPRTSMSNIAKLVDHDPSLAARFVALASSAAFARGARISSTQGALVRLGLASSRDLLLRAAYERSNGELPKYQEQVSRSFDASVRMAVAARAVSRDVAGPKFELAYLCGLLHDIGEARVYRILASMKLDVDATIAADLVAHHHTQAGADVARAWRLPPAIVEACLAHHGPVEGATVAARVVMAATSLVHLVDEAEEEPSYLVKHPDYQRLVALSVPPPRIPSLIASLKTELADPDAPAV
jgi:diguanylate cyclase (GGDEF)-like protein/putative nucleotidyltransferase with HDIG domain